MVRLYLRRETADPVGAGQDPCPNPQDVTARPRGRADPDQPDHARLDQLLPTCRCATHLQPPPGVHVVADRAHDAHPAPLEVEGRPPDRNGRWRPITADGIEMFNPAAVPI